MRYDPERHIWAPLAVAEVVALLAGCGSRWWLSGGWAVDHWLGAGTRDHADIDISTLRSGLSEVLRCLPADLIAMAARRGQLSPIGSALDDPQLHNIWVYAAHLDRWVLQINLEAGDETRWRYRRDERIALPWTRAVSVIRSVPTGSPGTQLLWKSADPRPRDHADLAAVLGRLDVSERSWLLESVRTAHPGSPWAHGTALSAEQDRNTPR